MPHIQAVQRSTPAGRGRTAQLHLTPAGDRLLARGKDIVATSGDAMLAGLQPDDQRQLTALLLQAFAATGGGLGRSARPAP